MAHDIGMSGNGGGRGLVHLRLTPAELRVAPGISRGESLAEIARTHGISVKTVRTQLKAVFAKTGTHRQAELAAMMLRGAG